MLRRRGRGYVTPGTVLGSACAPPLQHWERQRRALHVSQAPSAQRKTRTWNTQPHGSRILQLSGFSVHKLSPSLSLSLLQCISRSLSPPPLSLSLSVPLSPLLVLFTSSGCIVFDYSSQPSSSTSFLVCYCSTLRWWLWDLILLAIKCQAQ